MIGENMCCSFSRSDDSPPKDLLAIAFVTEHLETAVCWGL